jgi:hypothetical protein
MTLYATALILQAQSKSRKAGRGADVALLGHDEWLGRVAADAILYSVDSMTTRGSSNGLYLDRQWRVMGATEAGDGMLLFGVSTAFLFYVMVRVWKREFV